MRLVEQHIIKRNHPYFKECNDICFRAKNLYNYALYVTREAFFETGVVPSANEVRKQFAKEDQPDFRALPSQVAKEVLRKLGDNWKSFFNANKQYKKDKSKFLGRPNLPKYKDKAKGRFVAQYYNPEAISVKLMKKDIIKLSQTNIELPRKGRDIKVVRIVPRYGYYVIEVVYRVQEKQSNTDNKRYAAIDVGVNNLMAVTFNTGNKPLLINGRPLKSVNQFYNKRKAELMSFVGDKGTSNRIQKLTAKRNFKVKDYLHKQTRLLVNHIASLDVSKVYIGWNQGIKQDTNMGKRNNQQFVSIPFYQMIGMLDYKLKLKGIELTKHEESYTSKCSFLDLESIKNHDKYLGSRVKRGLFKSNYGTIINADINASYNIGRKSNPEFLRNDRIEVLQNPCGFPLVPFRLTPNKDAVHIAS